MQLRKKKAHSAEVNMSSMTDIVFMLLIFFMLTSSLVKFLDYDLAKSDSRAKAPNKINVEVRTDGSMEVNDRPATKETLEAMIIEEVKKKGVKPNEVTITILAEKTAARDLWDLPVRVANKLKAKAIMAADPKN